MNYHDFFQNFRISDAKDDAARAGIKAGNARIDIRDLQDQVDQLSLVCSAMCELLEEIGFNKEMLIHKVREIDLRDGKLDGKLAITNVCGSCNRTLASRHIRCMYCGSRVKAKVDNAQV